MGHDTSPHPNGDGLEIVQHHMDTFYTPKHSGFDTPIGDENFTVLLPGEFVKVPAFPLTLKDRNFPIDANPSQRRLVNVTIYTITYLTSGQPGSLTTNAQVLAGIKAFNDVIDRMNNVYNIPVSFGLLELRLDAADLASEISGAGGTMPPSITVVKGTNTNLDSNQPDYAGIATVADLNAARSAAGPATTSDWQHIFGFRFATVSTFTGGGEVNRRADMNNNIQSFLNGLNGGVYGLSPFDELVSAREYLSGITGGGSQLGGNDIAASVLPFYTSTQVDGHVTPHNLFTVLMREASFACHEGYGIRFSYRAPDAVTSFSVTPTAGRQFTVSWSPPNTTPEYDQTNATDAVYVADDPFKLVVNSHDIIPSVDGDSNFEPLDRLSCAKRYLRTSPFTFNPSGDLIDAGKTAYFLIRTRSSPFGRNYTFFVGGLGTNVVDGEETSILSGVAFS